MRKNLLVIYCFFALSVLHCNAGFQSRSQVELGQAQVVVSKDKITASTGVVTRVWKLSKLGLSTVNFKLKDGHNLIHKKKNSCDWDFPWIVDEEKADLVVIKNYKDNDEGFLNQFIRTTVEFHYSHAQIGLVYDIWTLPEAPGFRTQISLKNLTSSTVLEEFSEGTVERLYLKKTFAKVKATGYYNDTQNRNKANTPILKDEEIVLSTPQVIDWSNLVRFSQGKEGLVLVKESHKCVNQKGVNTGAFNFNSKEVEVVGTGLDKKHLSSSYQPCWATWSILYHGDEVAAQLALKQFDRKRYPIDPKRDIYIMSNTWGSGSSGANSKYASREENILKELAVSKELGLDLLQIDDGWQGTDYKKWETVKMAVYKAPRIESLLPDKSVYEVYPKGWATVRQAAKESAVKLGLWAAWIIPEEDLTTNFKLGGFSSYKLDFANLKDYQTLRGFEQKVRQFILNTDHQVRVNWDVTENAPRIGYYFAREYGNIYLENRKPLTPKSVVYHPWLVLRDAWHVAKYLNLNKFQVTYQNVDRVNRNVSDAYKHDHAYALAITLMASPIFFQEIHLLNETAKAAIKPLIKRYKSVRNDLFKGYVFAIGEEPTNASWTGFQNYNPLTKSGYVTLFRELNCKQPAYQFELNFVKGKDLIIEDLMTGRTWEMSNFEKLPASFENGQFQFLSYRVKE